jgi:hypothetical protein
LITRVRPHARRDLWDGESGSKYTKAQNFNETGMRRHRFDELPVRLELEIQQTSMSKSDYDMCGAIDQLNRQLQDDLEFERCLRFKTFDKRVGSSIHAIIIVNAMNFHQLLAARINGSVLSRIS